MWGIGKLPSGKECVVLKNGGNAIILGKLTEGDKLFMEIEQELQQQQRQKTTQAAVDKLNKKK